MEHKKTYARKAVLEPTICLDKLIWYNHNLSAQTNFVLNICPSLSRAVNIILYYFLLIQKEKNHSEKKIIQKKKKKNPPSRFNQILFSLSMFSMFSIYLYEFLYLFYIGSTVLPACMNIFSIFSLYVFSLNVQ